jgi:HEPN domain-containing protein
MLYEGLQNAEDSGATRFDVLLDLRSHCMEGLRHPELARCAGPAFVLADNGVGFDERNWRSLQNLHQSEKKDSPREIGRFGMGSRSYFHYTDIIAVVSKMRYVGLDPLRICDTGGWSCNVSDVGEAEARPFLLEEFGCNMQTGVSGAVFRLPLRRKAHVDEGLGPEITVQHAAEMITDWTRQLGDGRVLLFLSSVTQIKLWIWSPGNPAPNLLASVGKRYVAGVPFQRLPSSLPASATESYASLAKYLASLPVAASQELVTSRAAVVAIDTAARLPPSPGPRAQSGPSVITAAAPVHWLVVQQFAASAADLVDLIAQCGAAPVVGVALPLDAGQPVDGAAFCFLPIGDLITGLPVLLNASFHVHKNRRSIWLDTRGVGGSGSLGLVGQQRAWATWNRALLDHALPALWRSALELLASSSEPFLPSCFSANSDNSIAAAIHAALNSTLSAPAAAAAVMASLPDLTRVHPEWLSCAVSLYQQLGNAAVLPHTREPCPAWVAPSRARAVQHVQNAADGGQLSESESSSNHAMLMNLYAGCHGAPGYILVVSLPPHVQSACAAHSGLTVWKLEELLENVLIPHYTSESPSAQLSPAIFLLAEYAGRHFTTSLHLKWRGLLSNQAWVPLMGSAPSHPVLVKVTEVFQPDLDHLRGLHVVEASMPNLFCKGVAVVDADAVLISCRQWGMRLELNWREVVEEAHLVEKQLPMDLEGGQLLIQYISSRHTEIKAESLRSCRHLSWEQAAEELKNTAFAPAVKPSKLVPTSNRPERGSPFLASPGYILPYENLPFVWAAFPTAAAPSVGMCSSCFETMDAFHVVGQISELVKLSPSEPTASLFLVEHILNACQKLSHSHLSHFGMSLKNSEKLVLSNTAWVPCSKSGVVNFASKSNMTLMLPRRVTIAWTYDLWPSFGRLCERWREDSSVVKILESVGVVRHLSAEVLQTELSLMAEKAKEEILCDPDLQLAINFASELAKRIKEENDLLGITGSRANPLERLLVLGPIFVPTVSGKLMPSKLVFINDAQWSNGSKCIELLNGEIGNRIGLLLGCTSVRMELARLCEVDDTENFGQHEDLSSRILGLLNDYNEPSDLFTEHMQNCDDAGAISVGFILDGTQYGLEQLVDDRAKILQGSALILASSKELCDDDIVRIQNFGSSQKKSDFTKAGRFGVGLSCCYHFTDAPQLLANGSLHIFDPLNMAVAHKRNGMKSGRKYDCVRLKEKFPQTSMLKPFEILIPPCSEYSTLFRLPLRTRESKFGRTVDFKNVMKLLQEFCGKLEELLVFSKNICTVSVTVVAENGTSEVLASLRCKKSMQCRFMSQLPKCLADVVALQDETRVCIENVTLEGNIAKSTVHSGWIISHAVSADAGMISYIREEFESGRSALLPHGAVALQLNHDSQTFSSYAGNVCCTFPLGMPCGVPVLLHGCFSLPTSRKSIPLPDETSLTQQSGQKLWNKSLLRGPIAASLKELLLFCRGAIDENKMNLQDWFKLLELPDCASNKTTKQLRMIVRDATIQHMLQENCEVLPVLISTSRSDPFKLAEGSHISMWLPATSSTLIRSESLCPLVQNTLVQAGMLLAVLSNQLLDLFVSIAMRSKILKGPRFMLPEDLCKFVSSQPIRSLMCGNSDNIQIQVLSRPETALELLIFILQMFRPADPSMPVRSQDLSVLLNVPLMRLHSNTLTVFGSHIYWDWPELLPHVPNFFIHSTMRELLGSIQQKSTEPLMSLMHDCQIIGISPLLPDNLLMHRQALHEKATTESDIWQSSFWQLIWRHKKTVDLMGSFGDWKILRVHSVRGPLFVELRKCSHTFSLVQTEQSWQADIQSILMDCNLYVLHKDHECNEHQMDMLQGLVSSGDEALVRILVDLPKTHLNLLSATKRAKLLMYFEKRKDQSQYFYSLIKQLPLFLLSGVKTGAENGFISLDSGRNHICLKDDPNLKIKHAPALMRLNILGPEENCFLAWPTEDFTVMYKRLGVCLVLSSDFTMHTVCPKLTQAALVFDDTSNPLCHMLSELESWIFQESDHWSTVIASAALTSGKFVKTALGEFVSPVELLDPDTRASKAFLSVLQKWFPHSTLENHNNLLRKLGMHSNMCAEQVLACAKELDTRSKLNEAAGESKAQDSCKGMMEQSYVVVQELCECICSFFEHEKDRGCQKGKLKSLQCAEELERDSTVRTLKEASNLNILTASDFRVITGPSVSKRSVLIVLKRARHGKILLEREWPGVSKSGTGERPIFNVLVPLSSGVVLPSCMHLAWATHLVAAHCSPSVCSEKNMLLSLCEANGNELNDFFSLGFCSKPSHLSGISLATQLQVISSAIEECDLRIGIMSHSCLSSDIMEIFSALESKLTHYISVDLTAFKFLTSRLESMKSKCLPLDKSSDASGKFDYGGLMLLVEPSRTFLRLPEHSRRQQFLHEADLTTQRNYPETLKALGVKESPSYTDWVVCTHVMFEESKESEILESEIKVLEIAIQSIVYLLQNSLPHDFVQFDIYLLDQEKHFVSSKNLVWPDQIDLKCRCINLFKCTGKKFPHKELPLFDQAQRLCQVSTMRKLSQEVHDVLIHDPISVPPNQYERNFLEFLKSREFAIGMMSILVDENRAIDPQDTYTNIVKILSRICFCWSNGIETVLKSMIDGTLIKGSERRQNVFLEMNSGNLLLCAGILGDSEKGEDNLLADLSKRLNFIFHANNLPSVNGLHHVMVVLKCWKSGVDTILPALEDFSGIQTSTDRGNSGLHYEVGTFVSPVLHEFLSQSLFCIFEVDELVAIISDVVDGIQRYRFGRICNLIGQKGHGGGCLDLSRQYLVLTGNASENYVEYKHASIFKITRIKKHQEEIDSEDQILLDSGIGVSRSDPRAVNATERNLQRDLKKEDETFDIDSDAAGLLSLLQQMEVYDAADYKAILRRLFLQWHPDKCTKPYAKRFFEIVRRHQETFHGDKCFSWLTDQLDQAKSEDTSQPSGSSSSFPQTWHTEGPNDWWQEFERERSEGNKSHPLPHYGQGFGKFVPSESAHRGSQHHNLRLTCCTHADIEWTCALEAQAAGKNLAGVKMWAVSVWHAQQAVEHAVKSLMLRTCGITPEEMKGHGAHNIKELLLQIQAWHPTDPCPVTKEQIQKLSDAYIRARYAPFPPVGSQHLPSELYGEVDAKAACDSVVALLNWGRRIYTLPVPRKGKHPQMNTKME